MEIDLVPVSTDRDGGMSCGSLTFAGYLPDVKAPLSDYRVVRTSLQSSVEERKGIIAIMDIRGLRRRDIDETLLKNLRIRGSDIWFMTCISDADDLLDAFNTDADRILMPMHLVDDGHELDTIMAMSDSVIPVIFSVDRFTDSYMGRMDVQRMVGKLERKGFSTMVVLDTDGRLNINDWKDLAYYDVIPCTRSVTAEDLQSLGYERILRYPL